MRVRNASHRIALNVRKSVWFSNASILPQIKYVNRTQLLTIRRRIRSSILAAVRWKIKSSRTLTCLTDVGVLEVFPNRKTFLFLSVFFSEILPHRTIWFYEGFTPKVYDKRVNLKWFPRFKNAFASNVFEDIPNAEVRRFTLSFQRKHPSVLGSFLSCILNTRTQFSARMYVQTHTRTQQQSSIRTVLRRKSNLTGHKLIVSSEGLVTGEESGKVPDGICINCSDLQCFRLSAVAVAAKLSTV